MIEDAPFDDSSLRTSISSWISFYGYTKRVGHDIIRIILSGRDSGPDLYAMMLVMGKERVAARFTRAIEDLGCPGFTEMLREESLESSAL